MKTKEVTVHYHEKRGLRNFSSVELGLGKTFELAEGENENESVNKVLGFLKGKVETMLSAIEKEKGGRSDEKRGL